MPLQSKLFTVPRDQKLEDCLIRDSAHITPGTQGEHVKKIQIALNQLSDGKVFLIIDGKYGPKTAAAVKAYKTAPSRRILGPGQITADDIVGKGTIKSLDDEMGIFENESDSSSNFVSTTVLGSPHDHSTCPLSGFSRPGSDNRVHHMATPINPLGNGRKINIGGEDETKYLGFQDFSTRDVTSGGPPIGSPPGRPFTESLPSRCASDICMRDTVVNSEIRKEISRLALPGCRLTVAQNTLVEVNNNRPFLLSLGVVLEDAVIFNNSADGLDHEVIVIAMRGDGRYVETSNQRVFPPGKVVRVGPSAQVLS